MRCCVDTSERIFVTGAGGFLGKVVVRQLGDAGYTDVVCNDACLLCEHETNDKLGFLHPKVVVHLAAHCGGIGWNCERGAKMFEPNVRMTANLLTACRDAEYVVLMGSTCAYPSGCPMPFREEDLWLGYPEPTNAAYGIAKRCMSMLLEASGLRGVTLYPANLYGPGDHFEEYRSHVIPALVRKCVEAAERGETSVGCWGSGEAEREFLYVEDCAEAVVSAIRWRDSFADKVLNVGSGEVVTIRELLVKIAAYSGIPEASLNVRFDATKPDGQRRRLLDSSRAERALRFRARTHLDNGLRRTVDWYRENRLDAGDPVA